MQCIRGFLNESDVHKNLENNLSFNFMLHGKHHNYIIVIEGEYYWGIDIDKLDLSRKAHL